MHWHLSVWKLTSIYDCYQISTSPATAVAVCHQGWSWVIIFTEEKAELSSMSHCLHLVSCYKRQFWTSPLLNTELETKVSENTCLLLRHVMSSFPFILKLFILPTWWKKKKKPKQPKLWATDSYHRDPVLRQQWNACYPVRQKIISCSWITKHVFTTDTVSAI